MSLTFRITLFQSGSHCWTAPWWAFYAWLISTLKARGGGPALFSSLCLLLTNPVPSITAPEGMQLPLSCFCCEVSLLLPTFWLHASYWFNHMYWGLELKTRLIWVCRFDFSTITKFLKKKKCRCRSEWFRFMEHYLPKSHFYSVIDDKKSYWV